MFGAKSLLEIERSPLKVVLRVFTIDIIISMMIEQRRVLLIQTLASRAKNGLTRRGILLSFGATAAMSGRIA